MDQREGINKEIIHNGVIVQRTMYTDDIFLLELHAPAIADIAVPGQFVNIACDGFLRRPISICGLDRKRGTFRVAIRVKGHGTEYLRDREIGAVLSIQGPLGNSFDLTDVRRCIVVGGGIGIFPLMFLLDEARLRGIETVAVCGYRSADESFCTREMQSKADVVCFASDRGGMDFHGNASQALSQIVDWTDATVFTCGPAPMMRSVATFCIEHDLPCFVSLEERMGCGTGICLVCSCKVKAGTDDFEYKRCCCDGPVFAASEVLWE
jgi:dihydroorotate dehydrogenase electron transfer subunit